jgi:hypothetical protein
MEKPVIVLDEGARDVGLAEMMFNLIRQNLEQNPQKIKGFNSLDAKVMIEARDIQIIIGLEFEQGRLTVSKGFSPKPDLHIISDSETILALCLVKIKFGLPYFFDANGFRIFKKLLSGELVIKGLMSQFPSLVKLTKIFSVVKN